MPSDSEIHKFIKNYQNNCCNLKAIASLSQNRSQKVGIAIDSWESVSVVSVIVLMTENVKNTLFSQV